MSMLDKLTKLAHYVEITVPSTIDIELIASAELIARVIDKVSSALAKKFGGATVTDGQGKWYSSELGKLVSESVKIVKSFAPDLDDDSLDLIVDTALMVKEELSQESVLINVDGIAYLV